MRFAIDAHTIGRHLTGNEVYVRNLLENYARLDRDAQFLAYVCSEYAASEVPNRFQKSFVSVNPFWRLGLDLSWRSVADRPDVLHVQYTAPLYSAVPLVVSVHDVSYIDFPHYFKRARSLQLRTTVKNTVARAKKIITVSEFSRQRIQATYNVAPELVKVIYNGVSPAFRPIAPSQAFTWVSQRFGVQWPYVLSVGDLQPRKNHLGLIEAFTDLLRENPQLPHHLLLVGKPTWFAQRVYDAARVSPVADRIHFTGFVNDEDLLHLYNAAELFVYPSHYEGFGLPIVEAQACGRAVACSNTSAMPEVADSAALLFDPTSREEMYRAMRDLLIDPELRTRMERLGQKNSLRFSWERAAEQTLDVYYEVAGRPRRRAPQGVRSRKSSAARSAS
ncbi:MAG: glycosyltransferase family 1 protein [Bryobacter sp.]|nr:glycosyltransferase family 1 protein [Bryobacter sp.]